MEVNNIIFLTIIMFNIYSLNTNGLRDVEKLKKVFYLLEEWRSDFVLLQETFWDDSILNNIKHLWNGDIYYSNSANLRSGVAILVNKKWSNRVNLLNSDVNGRFVNIGVSIEECDFKLMSIYAPTNYLQRIDFFNNISQCIDNQTIIGGDFNTSLSQIDRHNTIHNVDRAYRELVKLIETNNLVDIWRNRNKNSNVFSWKRIVNGMIKLSRIDYYLVPKNFSRYIKNVFYKHTCISDHNFVYMKLDFAQTEIGPGIWVMNNNFLLEDEYHNKIIELIDKEKQDILYNREKLVWWDNMKYKIRRISQKYGCIRSKKRYEKYNKLQRMMEKFNNDLKAGKPFNIIQYEQLRDEISQIEQEHCQGAILRSKAKWAVEGDKNTKYFLNLEKYRQSNRTITEVFSDNGDIVTDNMAILDEEYKYYRKLYTCVQSNEKDIVEFLGNISKKVNLNQQQDCDKNITKDEIYTALRTMNKQKSPGSDGLTVEFYLHFWTNIGDILLEIYNEINKDNEMARSMKHGLITLIYKKGDKRKLKNYRPISLLNTDYKILSRIMSNRLKKVLPDIISQDQTSCIVGRDISDTVSSIRDIIDIADKENLEGYLLKIDQEKAFDRVDHTYLIRVLQTFGFGEKFCNWIKIFYTEIYSAVKTNGFISKYFPIKNSVRQGCPISALLFVLTMEPLNQAIRNTNDIRGIQIHNSNKISLLYQHADDTTLTVSDKQSIYKTFDILEKYGRASGAKVNKQKSEIMKLGVGDIEAEGIDKLEIKKCYGIIQVLGTYLGNDRKQCEESNWRDKVTKTKTILNMWKMRKLTIQGRAIVISSLLLSKLWYVLMTQPIPDWAEKEIRKTCLEFLWMKKSYPVKYLTIIGDKNLGGLNIPDINTKRKAFRLKFLSRFANKDHKTMWKECLKYYLQQAVGMNLGKEYLYLQLTKTQIAKLPKFYQEMFIAWTEIQDNIEKNFDYSSILNQPIFNNSRIQYKGRALHFGFFIKAGLIQIKDISYKVIPGFFRISTIREKIRKNCPEIAIETVDKAYMLIKNSMPIYWYKIIMSNFKQNITEATNVNTDLVVINNTVTCLFSQCSSSYFYKILRNKIIQEPISRIAWKEVFVNIDMVKAASFVHMNTKCPDMIELDFKLFHNIVYTYEKLFKIGYVNTDMCPFCGQEIENIIHMFIKCKRLSKFIDFIVFHLENLFRHTNNDYVNRLHFDQILLLGYHENHKDVNQVFINFYLSQARLGIYKSRAYFIQSKKMINIISYFQYSLQNNLQYIYAHYQSKKQVTLFENYYINLNTLVKIENEQIHFNWK